jgi:hypothetical protein
MHFSNVMFKGICADGSVDLIALPVLEQPYDLLDNANHTHVDSRSHENRSPPTPIPATRDRDDKIRSLNSAPSASLDPWLELQNTEKESIRSTIACRSWETFALDQASALHRSSRSDVKSSFISELSLPHFQCVQER